MEALKMVRPYLLFSIMEYSWSYGQLLIERNMGNVVHFYYKIELAAFVYKCKYIQER